jgi:hypothetical protein
MAAKLIVTVIVIPLHGLVLNRAVHPLDLPVGPWMVRRCSISFEAQIMSNRIGRE